MASDVPMPGIALQLSSTPTPASASLTKAIILVSVKRAFFHLSDLLSFCQKTLLLKYLRYEKLKLLRASPVAFAA